MARTGTSAIISLLSEQQRKYDLLVCCGCQPHQDEYKNSSVEVVRVYWNMPKEGIGKEEAISQAVRYYQEKISSSVWKVEAEKNSAWFVRRATFYSIALAVLEEILQELSE